MKTIKIYSRSRLFSNVRIKFHKVARKSSENIQVLQLKTYRVKSEEKSYIRVNTRELNGVPKYNLSILYILGSWSILH